MAKVTAPHSESESDQHGYHSAVEVDESFDNWRDWIGPGLAILFLIAAIVALVMVVNGQI